MDRPESNEDKQAWCQLGAAREEPFTRRSFLGCRFSMNPAKAHDKYAHDLEMTVPSDLKTITTRFRMAESLYGISSRSAITLNAKDVERYRRHPHMVIVFDIDYGDFRRTCKASMPEIERLIRDGKARLHAYKDRVGDTAGNATESYVLDSLWFQPVKEQ
jgi:hypothetical protein